MVHTRRRSIAVAGALAAAFVACRGEVAPGPEARTAEDEPLLVVEDRGPVVVSGRDTTMVLAPTVFAWFDVRPAGGPPDANALARFRQSLRDAQPGLEAMGVRVVARSAPPTVVELPPGAIAPEAPVGRPGASGYLLVDIDGHLDRRSGVLDGGALVCLASVTFRLTAPGC